MKKFTILLLLPFLAITLLLAGCGGKKEYTVTFNSDGGTSVSTQKVEEGKYAKEPTDPTKDGYEFVAWMDGEEEWDFTTPIKKDIKLKAEWKKEEPTSKVTVTFDSNGGTSVASQTLEKGEKATKPTNPTRTDYTFLGWNYENSLWDFSKSVDKDMKLVASWQKKTTTTGGGSTNPGNPTKPTNPEETAMNNAKNTLSKNGVTLVAAQPGKMTISSCNVTWTNPATLHHAVSATTQKVQVNITCGSKKATQTVTGKISASPYYYTAAINNNRLNYVIRVFNTSKVEQKDYYIKTDAGRSKYMVSVGYTTIDNAYFKTNHVYTLVMNNDAVNTYAIAQH